MNRAVVTVDVDWAPDWAMRELMELLVESGTPSTWFITHDTPVLDEMRQHPELIELGVHPNFLTGSSHGSTPVEILRTCMHLVPEARTMRTHCLVQSTPILQAVVDTTPITVDASIYLRDATGLQPSELPLNNGRSITRYAYVWEDDLEFFAKSPRWNGADLLDSRINLEHEITIVDVHPIHFALNSANIEPYHSLKRAHPDVKRVTAEQSAPFRNKGEGTRDFLATLIAGASDRATEFSTLSALHERVTAGVGGGAA